MPEAVTDFPQYSGNIMYPPRPKTSIPPEKVGDYEEKGYIAQLKYNGTRTLVEMSPGPTIKIWTRHKEPHKAYELTDAMRSDLLAIYMAGDMTKTMIFDGELMHSKTKNLKDTLVLFDILVCDSDHLIGMPMLARYSIMSDILGEPDQWEEETGRKIAAKCRVFELDEKDEVVERYLERVWMAETFYHSFSDVYKSRIDMDEVEGLVLKKPQAPLDRGFSETNNESWLIRCRKPSKNYEY